MSCRCVLCDRTFDSNPPEKTEAVVEPWPLRLYSKVDNKEARLKFIVVGDIYVINTMDTRCRAGCQIYLEECNSLRTIHYNVLKNF